MIEVGILSVFLLVFVCMMESDDFSISVMMLVASRRIGDKILSMINWMINQKMFDISLYVLTM